MHGKLENSGIDLSDTIPHDSVQCLNRVLIPVRSRASTSAQTLCCQIVMSAPFVSEDDTLVNADAECVVLVAGDAPALAACRSAAIKVASAPVEE